MIKVLLQLLLCASLSAADFYVAPYGNDSNDGLSTNAANAWATYGHAFSNATASSTIYLLEGTYAEKRMIVESYWPSGTSQAAPSKIMNYPGHTVILAPLDEAGITSEASYAIRFSASVCKSNQWVEGIHLDMTDFDSGSANHGGLLWEKGLNITVTNCSAANLPAGYGFFYFGQAPQGDVVTNAYVGDLRITNWSYANILKTDQPHALYFKGIQSSLIENIYMTNEATELALAPSGHGAALLIGEEADYYPASGMSNTFRNIEIRTKGLALQFTTHSGLGERLYNNIIATESTTEKCISTWGVYGVEFDNNTIIGGAYGVYVNWYGLYDSNIWRNNIFYGNGAGTGLFINGSVAETSSWTNNIVEGWTTDIDDRSGIQVFSGTINADPVFTDYPDDLHIENTSPGRNAGLTVSHVTDDIEGTARPQESVYDIGAYEYSSGGTLPVISVDVEASDLYCYESGLIAGNVWLTRSLDGTNGSTTVNLLWSGTATGEGTHYTQSATNSIDMVAGTVTTNVTVTPVDVAGYQGNLTVILTLDTGSYTLGAVDSHTITRVDGDAPSVYIK